MKRKISLIALVILSTIACMAGPKSKANKDTQQFRYEIECAGNGSQGTYLVKVWTMSKNKNVAIEHCKKNAVHGVLFKGYGRQNGCVPQKPIINKPGAEMENQEFFKLFFKDGGEYMKYVSVTAGTQEIIKIKGKGYRVGMVVSVSKDALRQAMEAAGIIRSLGAAF